MCGHIEMICREGETLYRRHLSLMPEDPAFPFEDVEALGRHALASFALDNRDHAEETDHGIELVLA